MNGTLEDRLLSEEELAEFKNLFSELPSVDFKDRISRDFEIIKFIGAGNLAGFIAITTLLLDKIDKHHELLTWARWSAIVYLVGFFVFTYSYWVLYIWYAQFGDFCEKAKQVKTVIDVGAVKKQMKISGEMEGYWKKSAAGSFCAFVAGCILVAIGFFKLQVQ